MNFVKIKKEIQSCSIMCSLNIAIYAEICIQEETMAAVMIGTPIFR